MPDVPTLPPQQADNDDQPQDLQGYQDDLDTSQRDQFANEAGSDPTKDSPATRSEWREGMRDTAGEDQAGGQTAIDDEADRRDDFRETIEDRDEDSQDVSGDDKGRSLDRWQ